jgi:hypothetical protein
MDSVDLGQSRLDLTRRIEIRRLGSTRTARWQHTAGAAAGPPEYTKIGAPGLGLDRGKGRGGGGRYEQRI